MEFSNLLQNQIYNHTLILPSPVAMRRFVMIMILLSFFICTTSAIEFGYMKKNQTKIKLIVEF
jgi:hypothetical protein